MSYMRGEVYAFRSSQSMNIWTNEAKVSLPLDAFDELAVMRMAQLSQEEVQAAQQRAVEKWGGNFGCSDLKQHYLREHRGDETKG